MAFALLVVVALGALGVVAPAPAGASAATDKAARDLLTLHNQARTSAGLPPLIWDGELSPTSVSWSNNMGSRNQLYHDPNLRNVVESVEPSWRSAGENVGVGYSVQSLHDAFMNSSGHRANIMSSRYNRVGIGFAITSGGKMWVTVRFIEGPAIVGPTGLGPCVGARTSAATIAGADLTGDEKDDLVAYGPGSAPDAMLRGAASRVFGPQSLSVGGTYVPLTGDFTGRGVADVLWYAAGGAADYLWRWNGSGWSSTALGIGGTFQPSVGDLDGDGRDDILWYAPGSAPDYVWYGTSTTGSFSNRPYTANGFYRVAIADLDGDSRSDIVWYAKGGAKDYIAYSTGRGSFTSIAVTINGDYRPAAGDFDGDYRDDIVWHAPGSAPDYVWYGLGTRGRYQSVGVTVNGDYDPVTGDFDGDCRSDVVWSADGSSVGSPIWYGGASRGSFGHDTVRTG